MLVVTQPQVPKVTRMDTHQNARLKVACRVLLVDRNPAGRPKAQGARELGASTKTADKWLRRYRANGRGGLNELRSRLTFRLSSDQSFGSPMRTAGLFSSADQPGTEIDWLSRLRDSARLPSVERARLEQLLSSESVSNAALGGTYPRVFERGLVDRSANQYPGTHDSGGVAGH